MPITVSQAGYFSSHLHVKERSPSVGAADAEGVWGAHLLQGKQEHGPAEDGPAAASEAACVLGAFLMLQLGAGCVKGHASVKSDGIAACLEAVVGIHPQSLQAQRHDFAHATNICGHRDISQLRGEPIDDCDSTGKCTQASHGYLGTQPTIAQHELATAN